MLQTENLKLNKIELTDSADITIINPNWDSIDDEITKIKSNKADTTYVDAKVADLVASAPETLDTLKELSEALGNDPNFATTVSTQIGTKVDKVEGKGLSTNDYTTTEKNKLAGIANNANNYVHPSTHAPSIIVQDSNNRFVTDAEKAAWNAKATTTTATSTSNGLMSSDDKSKLEGIASGATQVEASSTNGKIKINGTETTVYTHPTGTNPHGTTKADVGLGNVDNTSDLNKPISTAVQTALNGKANSSHTHDYLPLSGGTVSGSTVFTQGTRIHCADASKGTSGYLHVAQIKITASYTNQPIMISFVQRGQAQINTVEIAFVNSTSKDPSLSTFVKTGSANVYIYKSETSTWDLYIKKTESCDNIDIIDFKKGSHMDGLTITWKNALVASVPEGYTTASTKSIITNISGNASTATKLQTARTINGVSFDGSANITTANWGTARTLTIGDTGKSVDGSANVSWSLSEIGASPTSHTHNAIVSRGVVAAESTTEKPAVAGMSMAQVYNNGYPTAFGNLISLSGDGHGQILVGWPGKNGVSSPVYVRSKRDVSDANWSDWAQFYTSANPQTNISGNAGTATKLQTARTITLGGDYSGSVSFDGSNNVTLTGYNYHCKISKGNTNNYPFSRIAHIEGTDSHIDKSITLLMSQGFQGGKFGIIKITLRSDSQNSTSGPWARVEAVWLVRSGYNVDEIQVGLVNKSNDWSADVFYKCTKPYESTIIKQIDSGGRGTVGRTWTLINSVESNNTTTTTNNTTECYTDISDYKTYSSIVTSYDAGTVQSANKLTNTRKINGVSFDGTSDITVADSTKLPINGGTMYGDVIFSGIRRLKWDCGRSNQSEIFWNASPTKDLGVLHRVDGVDSMIVNSGNIHMKNPLKITNLGSEDGQIRLTQGNTGFIIRNDGADTYFMVTEKGDPNGTFTSARPITILGADGTCLINGVSVASEINSLKSSVVSGKQAVVDAINGKLGYASGLTTNHAFSDYNWWITHKIQSVPTINSTASSSARVNGYFPYVKDAISENRMSQSQSITVDGAYILFVTYSNSEALYISPVSSTIKVYKNDGSEEATVVDVGGKTSTDFVECFIINPQRTPITFTKQNYSTSVRNPAVRIMIQ